MTPLLSLSVCPYVRYVHSGSHEWFMSCNSFLNMHVYACLFASVCVCVCLSVCLPLCLYVCVFVCVRVCIHHCR